MVERIVYDSENVAEIVRLYGNVPPYLVNPDSSRSEEDLKLILDCEKKGFYSGESNLDSVSYDCLNDSEECYFVDSYDIGRMNLDPEERTRENLRLILNCAATGLYGESYGGEK
ncbi:hypothetical protein HOE04_03735 [archaeon]|nr:hypothetical protein [archaeon]